MIPWSAVFSWRFLALARPFSRNRRTAPSTSPALSSSARLQSIMPAPVLVRRSLTCPADISHSAIVYLHFLNQLSVIRPPGAAPRGTSLPARVRPSLRWPPRRLLPPSPWSHHRTTRALSPGLRCPCLLYTSPSP